MSKPFCVAPFVNFYYKGSIQKDKVLPCCEGRIDHSQPKQSYDDWWQGDMFREVRQSMLDGKAHDICTRCISVEKDGGYNARAFYQQIVDHWEKNNKDTLEWNVDTGTQIGAPIAVDYRSSNLCNLKCRMCYPANSSEIAREVLDNDDYNQYGFNAYTHQLFNRNDRNDFIDGIPLENVQRFKVLGGEPLIQLEVYEALDKMLEHQPENVSIIITTNGTTIPVRFIEYLEKFKQFAMRISLDGIDCTHEYIRTNANWNKIENNCKRFAELSESHNLRAGFSFVVQAYNAFQLADIAEFCIEWKEQYPNWRETFFAPIEQDWMSTAVLDADDIQFVTEQLNEIDGKYPDNDVTAIILEIIHQFDTKRKVTGHSQQQWIEYTKMQDNIRKTNIVDVSKRFGKYFNG